MGSIIIDETKLVCIFIFISVVCLIVGFIIGRIWEKYIYRLDFEDDDYEDEEENNILDYAIYEYYEPEDGKIIDILYHKKRKK